MGRSQCLPRTAFSSILTAFADQRFKFHDDDSELRRFDSSGDEYLQLGGPWTLSHRLHDDRGQRVGLFGRLLQEKAPEYVQLLPRVVGSQRHAVGDHRDAAVNY